VLPGGQGGRLDRGGEGLARPAPVLFGEVVSRPPIDARIRNLTATEVLELRLIPDEGLVFDEALPGVWLDEEVLADEAEAVLEYRAAGPATLHLTVEPVGPVGSRPPISLRGEVRARLLAACVRCLSDVEAETVAPIETTLLPVDAAKAQQLLAGQAPAPAAPAGRGAKARKRRDGELDDWSDLEMPSLEQLEEGSYDQRGVDLPGIVREAILLALEMNPTCADEAACDARTAALIDEANRPFAEAEAAGDPRWAALRDLGGRGGDADG
jgi:uncharacterized metal-binding protein YceD (DUF177 family)